MAVALKYVLYFKVQLKVRAEVQLHSYSYENVLQKTYFKNVLKDGFIDPQKVSLQICHLIQIRTQKHKSTKKIGVKAYARLNAPKMYSESSVPRACC